VEAGKLRFLTGTVKCCRVDRVVRIKSEPAPGLVAPIRWHIQRAASECLPPGEPGMLSRLAADANAVAPKAS